MSTPERLQRKLAADQRLMNHSVRTIVPAGWEPFDLMKSIAADIEWEKKTTARDRVMTQSTLNLLPRER